MPAFYHSTTLGSPGRRPLPAFYRVVEPVELVERQPFLYLVAEGPDAARPAVPPESEPAIVRRGWGVAPMIATCGRRRLDLR